METQPGPAATLLVWEKLGLSQEAFEKLPPSTRSALEREHNPQPPEKRRPVTRDLTAAELATLGEQAAREGWSQAEYTEKARALQQTPLPQP
jgi:hypothetical protein